MDVDGPSTPIAINVLALTNEARNEHGLRHQDYHRYRQYCAKKVHRVRKIVGMQQQVKGKKFEKKVVKAEVVSNASLPADARTTLDARAYASVMSGYRWIVLPTPAPSTIKCRQLGRRQRKRLCQSAMDAIDPNIRFCAYNLRMKGETDVAALLEVRGGGDLLAAQVDEVLAKSRQERAKEVHEIAWRGKSVPTRNAKLMEAVVGAQEVVAELERDGSMNGKALARRLDALEKVIGAYWDATKVAESDIKEDAITTAKIKSSKSEENTANLQFAFSYISYLRLRHTIDRIILIMDATALKLNNSFANSSISIGGDRKPPNRDDLVRQCDAILQTLAEMSELHSVQNDAVLQTIISAKTFIFKARRASQIGDLLLSTSKYPESSALFNRAREHTVHARSEVQRLSGRGRAALSTEDVAEMAWIDTHLKMEERRAIGGGLRCRAAAAVAASKVDVVEGVREMKLEEGEKKVVAVPPLSSRLDTFVGEVDIAHPNLAVPCKPVFFDIAYNGVEYPIENIERRIAGKERVSVGTRVAESNASQSIAAPGGISGFLSGIWGRK
ncbi:hypothetical protein BC829DRAFT_400506 [Chytridium lagenaria]|nr:hypothetical protein BC829DRAFT_400506 [Chytridium lagenaria]